MNLPVLSRNFTTWFLRSTINRWDHSAVLLHPVVLATGHLSSTVINDWCIAPPTDEPVFHANSPHKIRTTVAAMIATKIFSWSLVISVP